MAQRIELHKNKIFEPAIKKKMVGPNPLMFLRRNPNPRMGKPQNSRNEGKKKSPARQGQKNAREPSGKNWAGIHGDCQELGILGTCKKARMILRQLKKSAKKHKEREQIRPYQPPNDAERNQKTWKPTIHEQGVGTLGNPKRRTMKGSSGKNFQTGRKELAHLGKMTKEKAAKS